MANGNKPTFDFIASPNFSKRKKAINAIVVHYTESNNIDGTIAWFKSQASKVSSHYIVGRDGRLVQMVKDEDVAWHAGQSAMDPANTPPKEPNVNQFSIGIELVGTADSGFTDRQLASFYDLLQRLVAKYSIPPERVVGHCHIAPGRKIDPNGYDNQFPWAKTRQLAQETWNAIQTKSLSVNLVDVLKVTTSTSEG